MVKRGGNSSRMFSGGPSLFLGGGSFIMCKSDDNSWFCNLSKFVSVIQMIIFLIVIIILIYTLFKVYILKR